MALGYGQHVDPVASQGLAEGRPLADVSEVGVAFDFEHEVFEVAVSVRIAVCKVDFVVSVGEGVVPREGEVGFVVVATFTVTVLVILDILASSMPAHILLLALSFGVDDNLHAHLVEVVHLVLVQDIKLDCVILESVRHLEEEPLRVSVGVYIVLQQ